MLRRRRGLQLDEEIDVAALRIEPLAGSRTKDRERSHALTRSKRDERRQLLPKRCDHVFPVCLPNTKPAFPPTLGRPERPVLQRWWGGGNRTTRVRPDNSTFLRGTFSCYRQSYRNSGTAALPRFGGRGGPFPRPPPLLARVPGPFLRVAWDVRLGEITGNTSARSSP